MHMNNEISDLRDKLCKLIECDDINSPEVLALSQELDAFILEYLKCCMQTTKMSS